MCVFLKTDQENVGKLMTRVNSAIDPSTLCDQHLFAEYREMLRVVGESFRTDKSKIPTKFKLGTGHVKFFADKGLFMQIRHKTLVEELHRRQITTNFSYDDHKDGFHNSYSVTDEEFELLKERVTMRMPMSPRFYKKQVSRDEAIAMIKKWQQ